MRAVAVTQRPLLAALALAVALRLPSLDAPLGNDEAGSALVGASWLHGEHAAVASARLYGAYWLDRPPLLPLLYGSADLLAGSVGVRLLGMAFAMLLVGLCWSLARRIAEPSVAAIAAVLTAALASSPTLLGNHTYGELLAAVPATASVLVLVRVVERPGARRAAGLAVGAGVLGSCALLVKQSAFDALVVALVLAGAARLPRRLTAFGLLGVLAPIAATVAWATTRPVGVPGLWDALVGFRVDVLGAARPSDAAPGSGMVRLLVPFVLSGLVLLVPLAVLGVRAAGSRWLRVLLATWPLAVVAGMLGGGFYWPHYLLALVVPLVLPAVLALDRLPSHVRRGVLVLVVMASLAGTWTSRAIPHTGELNDDARAVGRAVAARADPDDELLVLFARPGVVHAAGLRSASPWLWSAMQPTRPGVHGLLVRRLAGDEPPRWVVRWNEPGAYGLDPDGTIAVLVARRYCLRATVASRTILELCDSLDGSSTAANAPVH